MKGERIRARYEATYNSYDELYRGEQYEKYFVALRTVAPRGSVLDAGCGTGLFVEYLYAYRLLDRVERLVCIDYSTNMLKIASWRIKALCPSKCLAVYGNVESMPFTSGAFDVVYSFTVVDLVDDPLGSLNEMARVSRGEVVVSVMKRHGTWRLVERMGGRRIASTDKDYVYLFNGREISAIS